MVTFDIIVAMAQNQCIGHQGQLPWHFPRDLQHFKKHSLHRTLIMGHNTYQSFPQPLPHRRHLVLSRHSTGDHEHPEVQFCASFEQALAHCDQQDAPIVIGGHKLYQLALEHPQVATLWLTLIQADYPGDTFFPASLPQLLRQGWIIQDQQDHPADDTHPHAFSFLQLIMKKS